MITITRSGDLRIEAELNQLVTQLRGLPQGAEQVWRDATPVRTGNARRRTRLQGDTIRADYNYAVPLDQGWSRKAPQGMSRPTEVWLRRTLRRMFGR